MTELDESNFEATEEWGWQNEMYVMYTVANDHWLENAVAANGYKEHRMAALLGTQLAEQCIQNMSSGPIDWSKIIDRFMWPRFWEISSDLTGWT